MSTIVATALVVVAVFGALYGALILALLFFMWRDRPRDEPRYGQELELRASCYPGNVRCPGIAYCACECHRYSKHKSCSR